MCLASWIGQFGISSRVRRMCLTSLRRYLFILCVVVSHADCQFWDSLRRYGQQPRLIECPVDGGQSFRCVPNYQCPNDQPRFSRYYCDWDDDEPLTCCQMQPAEQGCGLLHGASRVGPQDRILGAIVGGISLREASTSPWMAAVGERLVNGSIDWYCGGSLINPTTVLTAAHCVVRRKPSMVRVGELDLSRTNEPNASPEDVHITSTTVHPDYKLPSYYNDIAVLHLSRPVRQNKHVRPICLATNLSETYTEKMAVLTGWGHLTFGGDRSNVLQEVSVTVWNNAECKQAYAPPRVPAKNYPRGIVDSQLCAGDRKGGKDACQGDSGGPLVVKVGNTHTLIGIVSSGIGCGAKSFPGVYSRVSSFTDWINKQVKTKMPVNKFQNPGFANGPNRFNGNSRFPPFYCGPFNPC